MKLAKSGSISLVVILLSCSTIARADLIHVVGQYGFVLTVSGSDLTTLSGIGVPGNSTSPINGMAVGSTGIYTTVGNTLYRFAPNGLLLNTRSFGGFSLGDVSVSSFDNTLTFSASSSGNSSAFVYTGISGTNLSGNASFPLPVNAVLPVNGVAAGPNGVYAIIGNTLLRYAMNGQLLGTRSFNVTTLGDVFLNASDSTLALSASSSSGNFVFTVSGLDLTTINGIGVPGSTLIPVNGVAAGSNGVYATVGNTLYHYAPNGQLLNSRTFGGIAALGDLWITPVPEPSSLTLLMFTLFAAASRRFRRSPLFTAAR